ncbi:glycosyl transferase family 90-domain-containing protein [Coprinopsis sp. MPI-PUGE-AT-0042]|nr:glycosyl transferase family 90-domain-containing protein [Coprinopsis sp. MPI-PUGE-AT-0042]
MAGPRWLRFLPGRLRSRRTAVITLLFIFGITIYVQWTEWLMGVTATPKGLDFVRKFWSQDAFGFNITSTSDVPARSQRVNFAPAAHTYRSDGLLEVNPEGPHPIFELMERAERRWKKKNDRASRTLKQACEEYQRRYGRKPPRGFNDWFVDILSRRMRYRCPDEYDLILSNLAPFWGIDPRRLQETQHNWESKKDTYTIGKTSIGGELELITYAFHREKQAFTLGYRELKPLLQEVLDFIPPFRAIFNPHDNPAQLTNYDLLQSAIQAGKENTYIDVDKPPSPPRQGYLAACRSNAPALAHQYDYSSLPSLSDLARMKFNTSTKLGKTFIHDHQISMDPCLHPSHLYTHGQFEIVPQFSYSPSKLHHDITVAIPYNWVEDIEPRSDDPPFLQKPDSRLQWRGRTTGLFYRLVDWANPANGKPTTAESVLQSPPGKQWVVWGACSHNSSIRGVIGKMTDAAFASQPLECDPEVCQALKREHEFRMWQDEKKQGKYRYIIDIDGNSWSSRFKRLITSNSLVFKSTIYEEWFSDRVEPWLHYIPVQVDYSDLLDIIYFFRGDPSGLNAHPKLAEKIALAGREWSLTHWRKADLTAYMFRLFLEYARIMDTERENGGLDYTYRPEDEFDPKDAAIPGSRIGTKDKFRQVMDRRRQRVGN